MIFVTLDINRVGVGILFDVVNVKQVPTNQAFTAGVIEANESRFLLLYPICIIFHKKQIIPSFTSLVIQISQS